MPNRFAETSASNATVVFTASATIFSLSGGEGGSSGTATQASGGSANSSTSEDGGSGCASDGACIAMPHPENRRVGRFLTFSAAAPSRR